MLENLISLSISLLIGLLIGIERERSHQAHAGPIGVRTLILLSLLGTTTALLAQPIFTLTTSIFAFVLILLSYFRTTLQVRKSLNIGIVTEVSAAIVFCLGYITPKSPLSAVIISAIVLLVLIERKRLHKLAQKTFSPQEMEAAIILIIFLLGIVPILPAKTIDPWNLFNPQKFGILIATIASLQFGGYVAVRLFGERLGIALSGLLGGLISSTAVFANLRHTLKSHPKYFYSIIASGLLATVSMLFEIVMIVFVASPTLLLFILWPLVGMIIISLLLVGFLIHREKPALALTPSLKKPISIPSIINTSLFMGLTLILVTLSKSYAGTEGMMLVSFLTGLFEIHGISLATALLYIENYLKLYDASFVIYIAILASFVSKFLLLWVLTPFRFAFYTSLLLCIILVCGGSIYLVKPGLSF